MSKIRSMPRYGFLASSIGVTCAAALALPMTTPAATAAARTEGGAGAGRSAAPAVPGSTQSLRLAPLAPDRTAGAGPAQGLYRTGVRHFSLVGVVWDDPDTHLHGTVQVRTRSVARGTWSGWQDVDTHNADHGADPGSAERASGRVRGATAPLWVGGSDGVDLRVRADAGRRGAPAGPLPSGMRLELVDPGTAPPPKGSPARAPRRGAARGATAPAVDTGPAPLGATRIPALGRAETERGLLAPDDGPPAPRQQAKPYIGARPAIVTRRGWGADESLRESGFVYTKKVKVAFVHHTASGNNYTCAQAPSVIRSIYRYHVQSMGWRDIGYNFLVDKCGTLYEGRAGGVAKAVLGAHTMGFNTNSMGVAVIGSFGRTKPSAAAVKAIARLAAWKLGLYGMNPRATTYLTSGGGNLYAKGKNVRLNVISGHRDGYNTDCPGTQLYAKLGTVRSTAAGYQGR
ncbi:peptidoglycan recognition protein family protein [Streptomyces tropicalis]|uniref:Peptidoglycan recognition protein n=1 Tax=Streptomyces tropicalis TaxID=3034234 RepID=A0ABT6AAS6_9ACTN|nr:peptidoglycan recognition protein [Streptomyces tropicalis]MDF3301563.1 peptidoglycan recognition protein [Streptomyces tropicalis]